jgi:hypothetical protein
MVGYATLRQLRVKNGEFLNNQIVNLFLIIFGYIGNPSQIKHEKKQDKYKNKADNETKEKSIHLITQHPEILLTETDIEEDSFDDIIFQKKREQKKV